MTERERSWITAGLPAGAYETLARELPASRLWSLLLDVMQARAAARGTAALMEQWERDRFVQPGYLDQRTILEVDRHLLAAAPAFDAIELSPVAPLGVCSVMGLASQHKVLSALRGTEVISDPTNVMALECARRLRRNAAAPVRLATSHRCVRAQEIPKMRGLTANFRIFCLARAGFERQDHAVVVEAITEQMTVMLDALDRLEQNGFAFPDRRVTVLATAERAELADRIAATIAHPSVTRGVLEHPYYYGLRYQISARTVDGNAIPFVDGGAFDWIGRLLSNRKAVYVATGLGSQLIPLLFRRQGGPEATRSPSQNSSIDV
jgi:hypothetical protein